MKKLVMYNDQVPPLTNAIDDELKSLFTVIRPIIGFIPSCSDPERKYNGQRQAFYHRLGMDLKVYFELDKDWRPELLDSLLGCDAIHLSGGNTYYFLHWLRKRNMVDTLVRYVQRGGVLIGVSAGSILMTPYITTSSVCGDEMVEGKSDLIGLCLVVFSFVPHFGDRDFDISALRKYSREHQTAVYSCKDSAGIVVINDEVRCIGDVVKVFEVE